MSSCRAGNHQGRIQIVLLEGKVGQVKVAGNRWFSSSQIANGVELHLGESISQREMQRDLDWLNENPFRTTDLVYTPEKTSAD